MSWYMCMQVFSTGSQLQKRTLIAATVGASFPGIYWGPVLAPGQWGHGAALCILYLLMKKTHCQAHQDCSTCWAGRGQPISECCRWETGARHYLWTLIMLCWAHPKCHRDCHHPDTISCCRHSDYSLTVVMGWGAVSDGDFYNSKHPDHSLDFDSKLSLPLIL